MPGGYFYPKISESEGRPCQAFEAGMVKAIVCKNPDAGC